MFMPGREHSSTNNRNDDYNDDHNGNNITSGPALSRKLLMGGQERQRWRPNFTVPVHGRAR